MQQPLQTGWGLFWADSVCYKHPSLLHNTHLSAFLDSHGAAAAAAALCGITSINKEEEKTRKKK